MFFNWHNKPRKPKLSPYVFIPERGGFFKLKLEHPIVEQFRRLKVAYTPQLRRAGVVLVVLGVGYGVLQWQGVPSVSALGQTLQQGSQQVWGRWRNQEAQEQLQAIRLANVETLLSSGHCRKCDLTGMDLSSQNLAGADLSGSLLNGTDFSASNLQGADLSYVSAVEANFSWAFLQDAKAVGASFMKAQFRQVSGRGMNFYQATLDRAQCQGAIFSQAQFKEASLVQTNFNGTNLNEASFFMADLSKASSSWSTSAKEVVLPNGERGKLFGPAFLHSW